ncbi:hypothetical protein DM01DRAFT_1386833 [Hesseltinella vesiculosa]|uniref:GAR domain-containing protein n=1 Tax=Hesseltinella vesiculosa TaxID=101127 RepID=A0A1X2G4B7_9FUNG|nr:hypothetical protein DM01DRAFT_1386833 [Hesseltinella vesiculosa]
MISAPPNTTTLTSGNVTSTDDEFNAASLGQLEALLCRWINLQLGHPLLHHTTDLKHNPAAWRSLAKRFGLVGNEQGLDHLSDVAQAIYRLFVATTNDGQDLKHQSHLLSLAVMDGDDMVVLELLSCIALHWVCQVLSVNPELSPLASNDSAQEQPAKVLMFPTFRLGKLSFQTAWMNARSGLLKWIQAHYQLRLRDFSHDWKNGQALAQLIQHHQQYPHSVCEPPASPTTTNKENVHAKLTSLLTANTDLPADLLRPDDLLSLDPRMLEWPVFLYVFEFYLTSQRQQLLTSWDNLALPHPLSHPDADLIRQGNNLMSHAHLIFSPSHPILQHHADFTSGINVVKIMDAIHAELTFIESAITSLQLPSMSADDHAVQTANQHLQDLSMRLQMVHSSLSGLDDAFSSEVLDQPDFSRHRARMQDQALLVDHWLQQVHQGWDHTHAIFQSLQPCLRHVQEQETWMLTLGDPLKDNTCLQWMDALSAEPTLPLNQHGLAATQTTPWPDDLHNAAGTKKLVSDVYGSNQLSLISWQHTFDSLTLALDKLETDDLQLLRQHIHLPQHSPTAHEQDHQDQSSSEMRSKSLTPAETILIDMALSTDQLLKHVRRSLNNYGTWLQQLDSRYRWERHVAQLLDWLEVHHDALDTFLTDALWTEDIYPYHTQDADDQDQRLGAETLVSRLMEIEQELTEADRRLHPELAAAYQHLRDSDVADPILPDKMASSVETSHSSDTTRYAALTRRQRQLEAKMDNMARRAKLARRAVEQHLVMLDVLAQYRHLKSSGEKLRRRLMLSNDGLNNDSTTSLASEIQQFKEDASSYLTNVKRRIPDLSDTRLTTDSMTASPSSPIPDSVVRSSLDTDTTQAAIQNTLHTLGMNLALMIDNLDQLQADGHHLASLQRRISHTCDHIHRLNGWIVDRLGYLEKMTMDAIVVSTTNVFFASTTSTPSPMLEDSPLSATTFFPMSNSLPVLEAAKLLRLEKERDSIAARLEAAMEDELPKIADAVQDLQDDHQDGHAIVKERHRLLTKWESLGRSFQLLRHALDRHSLQLDTWKSYSDWYDLGRKTNQWILTNTKKLYDFCVKKACINLDANDAVSRASSSPSVPTMLAGSVNRDLAIHSSSSHPRELSATLRSYQDRLDLGERQMEQLDSAYQSLIHSLTALGDDVRQRQEETLALAQTQLVQKYRGYVHLYHYGTKLLDQHVAVADLLTQLQDATSDAERLADAMSKQIRHPKHTGTTVNEPCVLQQNGIKADGDLKPSSSFQDRVLAFHDLVEKIRPNAIVYPIHTAHNVHQDPALSAIFSWTRAEQEAHQARIKTAVQNKWSTLLNLRERLTALLDQWVGLQVQHTTVARYQNTAKSLQVWMDQQLASINDRQVNIALPEDDDLNDDIVVDINAGHFTERDADDDSLSPSTWDSAHASIVADINKFETAQWLPFQKELVQHHSHDKGKKDASFPLLDDLELAQMFQFVQQLWLALQQAVADEAIYLGAWKKKQGWKLALRRGRWQCSSLGVAVDDKWHQAFLYVLSWVADMTQDRAPLDTGDPITDEPLLSKLEAQLQTWSDDDLWIDTVPFIQHRFDDFVACFSTLPRPMATPDHIVATMDAWLHQVTRLKDSLGAKQKEWAMLRQLMTWLPCHHALMASLESCLDSLTIWWLDHAQQTTWVPDQALHLHVRMPCLQDEPVLATLDNLILDMTTNYAHDYPLLPILQEKQASIQALEQHLKLLDHWCHQLCQHHARGQDYWTQLQQWQTSKHLDHHALQRLRRDINCLVPSSTLESSTYHDLLRQYCQSMQCTLSSLLAPLLAASDIDAEDSQPSDQDPLVTSKLDDMSTLLKNLPMEHDTDDCLSIWVSCLARLPELCPPAAATLPLYDAQLDWMLSLLLEWLDKANKEDSRAIDALTDKSVSAESLAPSNPVDMLHQITEWQDTLATIRQARDQRCQQLVSLLSTYDQRLVDDVLSRLHDHSIDTAIRQLEERLAALTHTCQQHQKLQKQQRIWSMHVTNWLEHYVDTVDALAALNIRCRHWILVWSERVKQPLLHQQWQDDWRDTSALLEPLHDKYDHWTNNEHLHNTCHHPPVAALALTDRNRIDQALARYATINSAVQKAMASNKQWIDQAQVLDTLEQTLSQYHSSSTPLTLTASDFADLQVRLDAIHKFLDQWQSHELVVQDEDLHAQGQKNMLILRPIFDDVCQRVDQLSKRAAQQNLQSLITSLDRQYTTLERHLDAYCKVASILSSSRSASEAPWYVWEASSMLSLVSNHGQDLDTVKDFLDRFEADNDPQHSCDVAEALQYQRNQFQFHSAFHSIATLIHDQILSYKQSDTLQADEQPEDGLAWSGVDSLVDEESKKLGEGNGQSEKRKTVDMCKVAWGTFINDCQVWKRKQWQTDKMVAAGMAMEERLETYRDYPVSCTQESSANDGLRCADRDWMTLEQECQSLLEQLGDDDALKDVKDKLVSTLLVKQDEFARQRKQRKRQATLSRVDEALSALDEIIEATAPYLAAKKQPTKSTTLDKDHLARLQDQLTTTFSAHAKVIKSELSWVDAATKLHWERCHTAYTSRQRELEACLAQDDLFTQVAVVQSATHRLQQSQRKHRPQPQPQRQPHHRMPEPPHVGKFWFGNSSAQRRLVYCRILPSGMVMVRVGGGWMEFSKFLLDHGCTEGIIWKQKMDIGWQGVVTLRGGSGKVVASSSLSTCSTSTSIATQRSTLLSHSSPHPSGFMDGDRFIRIDASGQYLAVKMTKAHDDTFTPYSSRNKSPCHW